MRLPRFRLRTLLIAVAIAGLACGVVIERERRFDRRAAYHRQMSVRLGGKADPDSPLSRRPGDWHHEMMNKYERAARYPWLPVEPDPPEPE